ncbi:diaminopimelate decarboxylase [Actinomycetaceae bacterium WB03_NA08]|uniref:Diaminopimelate decarboxylase n=1 Tax=Scrofimicrobium canadense TaxID=2652290 RepID=A0A6N7VNC8_9ACTO|nr:diaminopimelate decarboxylase [Scrofimicrobium canadense]MSS83209.1 diaminopimelate decarboxylase [Scrofimicrobium canadense]
MKASPCSPDALDAALAQFPTPFYLYDESTLHQRVRDLQEAFSWNKGFREYFAVKALPNPAVLDVLRQLGCGADCASEAELIMANSIGLTGEDLMFTSNNTPAEEFVLARKLGAIINLDALNLVDFLDETAGIPDLVCVRYAPDHEIGTQNLIMGHAREAKFGMTREQIFTALASLQQRGARRFGVHCMAGSNSLNPTYYPELAREVFTLAVEIKNRLGIELEFVNFGGGVGIPYREDEEPLDIHAIGLGVQKVYAAILSPAGLEPALFTELGRYIAGPAGILVTRVRHIKDSYKRYVGVDASASDLLRPAMYGAYHHITVAGREDEDGTTLVDVVGSLCENNDKFAIDRRLPEVSPGDILIIHDAGAHGRSMGYNYNGKLRAAEVLIRADGTPQLIRRAETLDDYFATLTL